MNALFLGSFPDKEYIPHLKPYFKGITTYVLTEQLTMLSQLELYCEKRNITRIVSTNIAILAKLLSRLGNDVTAPKLSNYAGSLFSFGTATRIEIVFINPLKQLFTVPYGKFLAERYISKVISPSQWLEATTFRWSILTPDKCEAAYLDLCNAIAIAADIETLRNPLSIRCIGYTGVFIENNKLETRTYILPMTDEFMLAWMRKINASPPAKIFQNGKYDNSYLLRYNAPIYNWQWDTAHQFHCTYSELPKDLAFLNAFYLREVVYWKDLAETSDLHQYYKYNGLDTWATANVWIAWILSAPDYARHNYTLEFPLVFPCLLAEMTGLERDMERVKSVRASVDSQIATKTSSLQRMLGSPTFNSNSPPQVKKLLTILGCADIESTEEKDLKKAAYRHPLNGLIIELILDIRGLRKLASTYLRTDEDAKQTGKYAGEGGAKEFSGRLLYALNPHGTDTGRLASGEHAFWCGFNIQNQPRGPEIKSTYRASGNFLLGECDLEQAESRDTANISGDSALIAAVSGTRDFHSVNAAAFFGRPYEEIYDDARGKTKDKKLRDLAKRVNHGANYNMGPGILVETMGLPAIYEAASLLNLPFRDPMEIAEYLLCVFHKTYQKLRGQIVFRSPKVMAYLGIKSNPTNKLFEAGTYYASVAHEVTVSSRLVSRAYHHTPFNVANLAPDRAIETGDWTRYCFGSPAKNKLDLNSLVAHCPQSLNARTLNEAFMQVFYKIALPNPTTFRLHAQIHDSILFSYAPERPDHVLAVKECMEIPVTVRGIDGIKRTFTVPAAEKIGIKDKDGILKPAIYWNETE